MKFAIYEQHSNIIKFSKFEPKFYGSGYVCLYLLNYFRFNRPKIFYISTETALKSHSNMKKTCYKLISSACLLEFLEIRHTTQLYSIPLIDLAWVFRWFCARVFVLCSAIKRESSLILRNIRTRYFGGIYIAVSRKYILHENL